MISSFTKDQYELAMFRDTDNMTVTTGDDLTWPEINLLEGLRAGYKALTSWLMGVVGRQAKRTTELGNTSSGDRCDRAVEVHHEPVFPQPADRADNCINLAASLYNRYQEAGDITLLDEAMKLEREALALRPPGHQYRANACVSLGTSLYLHYQQAGDVALLDEAIELHREALVLRLSGHPDRADSCIILGASLYVRYQQTGDVALLDDAIELEREALALRPSDHPDRAASCANLGSSLSLRFQQSGDIALLDEAVTLARETLALRPPGHHSRAISCANLVALLHAGYQQTGDVAQLDEAIDLEREALVLQPPGHPHQANSYANLGSSLQALYEQTGDVALLDEAIELKREALVLRPPGHPDRLNSCASIASSLSLRFQQTGDVTLLDEAIELKREALALHPPGHPIRSNSCAHLASSLFLSYQQTGDDTLLDEAIELEREALALYSPDHPRRSNSCTSLGSSLYVRFQQTGNVTLLDEAIQLQREAVALQHPGHPDRSTSCGNLAASLSVYYEQTGDAMLLDEAIVLEREALALRPLGHPNRATGCVNLASSLYVRYRQTGDVLLLDEAIKLEREALALRPPGHPIRSSSCAHLASSLSLRFQQTGDVTLLDEAIELNREALMLRPVGHPDRSGSCVGLGSSLYVRYEQTGDVALLDEAITLEREALELRPPGHTDRAHSCISLGYSLSVRYQQTGDVALLNEALDACSYASKHLSASQVWYSLTWLSRLHLFPGSPHYSAMKALGHLHQAFLHEVDQIHNFILLVCYNVTLIWNDSSVWSPHIIALLIDVYANVVDRLPLVAGFVLDTSSRLKTLKSTRQVGSDACVAALLAEQPTTAVTILDRAHGVVWTQALHQRDPQMEGAPQDLAIELEELLRATATSIPVDPAILSDHLQDLRHRQNIRIQAILREIRAMPGLARFMLGSTYETLREAGRDHPVVVLVAARGHAFALIMSSSSHAGPDILRLDVASHTLQAFANSVGRANLRYRGYSPCDEDDPLVDLIGPGPDRKMGPGDHLTHRSPLAKLWLGVVKPVLTHLGLAKQEDPSRRPRLHWCTVGEFAPLPVHAAGIYAGAEQECCSDCVVSSYTPTLATLLRARRDLQPIPTANAKLLLIAAEHVATAQLPALPSVRIEMSEITGIADRAGIQYAASSRTVATPGKATAALPSATLVHIACHGLQDPEQPLKSAFHLSNDGVLSVSNLMELDLKGAYLAFLSACETAKGDREQSDQAIHLAATMLFVGFKSVVATMWAMRDADGPVVSKAFYEKLFEGEMITADSIPYALDHAVRKLRESGAPIGSWATFIHVGA